MSLLFKSWLNSKAGDSKKVRIASVAVFNKHGEILIGKRRDNNKETLPGGHLNEGEEPEAGAIRELQEETGLISNKLIYLGSGEVSDKNMIVYCYKLVTNDITDTKEDPDQEVFKWRWVSPNSDEFKKVLSNLHSPKNITLSLLGLHRWELDKSEDLIKSPVEMAAPAGFGDDSASHTSFKFWPKYVNSHKLNDKLWMHEFHTESPFTNRGTKTNSIRYYLSDKPHVDFNHIMGSVSGEHIVRPSNSEFQITSSGVMSKYRNRGYGKKMYDFVINQHKNVKSDTQVSPEAKHVYHSLAQNPKYKVKFGDKTSNTRHEVALKSEFDLFENYRYSEPEDMEKALKHKFLALAASAAMNAVTPTPVTAPKAPQAEQMQSVDHTQKAPPEMSENKPWHANGLANDLHPIAYLESGYGKNMTHAPSKKGDFSTAWGAVGFKPETAYDEYKHQSHLKNMYPGLEDKQKFTEQFKTNHTFYNTVASAHWNKLKSSFGTPEKAAYAWRWGAGAAMNSSNDQIHSDPYVQAYVKLNNKLNPQLKKSEFGEALEQWLNKNENIEKTTNNKVFVMSFKKA